MLEPQSLLVLSFIDFVLVIEEVQNKILQWLY